jgi:hypothetical protein
MLIGSGSDYPNLTDPVNGYHEIVLWFYLGL